METLKVLWPRLVLWALCIPLPDAALRREATWGAAGGVTLLYVLFLLLSLGLWLAALGGLARLRRRSRALFWAGASGFMVLVLGLVGITVRYRTVLEADPPPSAVSFLLQEPYFTWVLASEGLPLAWGLLVACLPLLFLGALGWLTRATPRARGGRWLVAPLLALPLCFSSAPWARALPVDLQGLKTLYLGVKFLAAGERRLVTGERLAPASQPPARSTPDVILFLQETLSAERWAPWNGEVSSPEGLSAFLARESPAAVWFPRASTVSGFTAVAVPALLTGLPPDASAADFARAPLVWGEARALGYTTALFSAHDFEYASFRQFFLESGGPDVARVAADFPQEPRVNAAGITDAVVVDAALAYLDTVPRERPIFMVVQLNATHVPCFAPGVVTLGGLPVGVADGLETRCAQAARYVEGEVLRFLEGLRARGRLERTLFLHTADHGDTLHPGRPSRLESYYEDVLRVPFFVRLPESFVQERPEALAHLRAHAARRVSHLDLYPTLLDVWGRWPMSPDAGRPPLRGQSLLRAPDEARRLLATNVGGIRRWSHQGFALYYRQWKWVKEDWSGLRLFNLDADPGERDNLAAAAPTDVRGAMEAEAALNPYLRDILQAPEPPARQR